MAQYQSVTLLQLQDKLKARTDGLGVFWVQEEARTALNEAIRMWQVLTGYWIGTFSVPASAQIYVDVPRQLVSLTRISHNTTALTLSAESELDLGSPGWESAAAGTPVYWAPMGFNKVAFSPAAATGNIIFEGITEPTLLFSGSDFINIGDEELTRVLDYAVHYLAFKEGPPEFDATSEQLQNFMKAAGLRNAKLRETMMYKRAMGLVRDEVLKPSTSSDFTPGARS